MPLVRHSAIASEVESLTLLRSSASIGDPITAAASSTSRPAGVSRDERASTASRTVTGMPPLPAASASTSFAKNGFPPVSR